MIDVLELSGQIFALEERLGLDLSASDSLRYQQRDHIHPLIESAVRNRDFHELTEALTEAGGCWGPYQKLSEAIKDPKMVMENPVFDTITNVSGISYPVPGAAATLPAQKRSAPLPAPKLGSDTRAVLRSLLALDNTEISQLIKDGIVAESATDQ